jgi:hypothetical protein
MKSIKMTSLALMGVLALGVYSAKAQPTGHFLKVKVSLTLQQQALLGSNPSGDGKTYISTTTKMKLNNKALLAYMEEMFDTTWPDGAQLVYEIGMGLEVADKTGTNVLFYCEPGVDNPSRRAYVALYWNNAPGPLSGKMVSDIPGSVNFTSRDQGIIEIYYNNYTDAFIYADLSGDGLNVEKISGKWTSEVETTSWKENFTPFAIGTFDGDNAIITGKITASGKAREPVI